MGKSILIFSDGTGQRGGLLFDERRSNIYKLYRATRCGPDSCINPSEQLAFYDPGLGTQLVGGSFAERTWRWVYNFVSQATGLGLTANIIDCYAAIITMWQPGDRIFLFGFSRGAYTVRCLGAVLALCGVPTRMKGDKVLKLDEGTARTIAKEAVRKVYQHVSSPRDTKYLPQRIALAERFRADYRSDSNGKSNAFPYFIGVFDTVASLANYTALTILAGAVLLTLLISCGFLWLFFSAFWWWFTLLMGTAVIFALIAYLITHLKFARGLKDYTVWQTLHMTDFKMKFYDQALNANVAYARHALSIDESRSDFARVRWGDPKVWKGGEPIWFEQIWFAGNHSDIGGSYPENESRLSDIALKWMVDAAQRVPDGIRVDGSVLQLYPSAAGMQHDECKRGVFRFARRKGRSLVTDATLHESVYERFKLSAVLHYDDMLPYRPEPLRHHEKLKEYYENGSES